MSRQLTTSRASRNRRLVAMSIWLGLIVTAMVMWNSRTQHTVISNPSEPVAFLLAAFTTFVSLFAWMLFNPARGVSAETTTLMLAGAATLFPPCIIAFCTMPPGSPLSGWLTAGLFVLLMIAVMSPVPEEFFGIPRDRHSYFQQVSMIGIAEHSVLDMHPDWLQSTDLTAAVPDSARPSLAPSSWPDDERIIPETRRRTSVARKPAAKKPAAETDSPEEKRGLLRRWRDRATSFRNTSASPDESTESAPAAERRRPATHESPGDNRSNRRRSRQDDSRGSIRPAPVPVVPPAPETRATPDSHEDSPPEAPLADLQLTMPVDSPTRPAKTRDTGRSAAAPDDPFTSDTTQPDSPGRRASSPSADNFQDDLQVADHTRQTKFERITDELGGEMIEGTVSIRFNQGQKRANVHVPFSPPLSGRPEVECETVDDDSIRVKVPECRAWGIRIEGRRTDTSTAQESEIAFSAVYVPAR